VLEIEKVGVEDFCHCKWSNIAHEKEHRIKRGQDKTQSW